jgi:hypothetical protein
MPLTALTSSFGSSEYAVPMAAHPAFRVGKLVPAPACRFG